MSNCAKCPSKIQDPKDVFVCDSCKKQLCKKCSDLSETEIRSYLLKKRRLTFLCEECEKGLSCIPVILKQIQDLQNEIIQLKQSVLCNSDSNMTSSNNVSECEEFISEMMERQKRSSNIMIANVKESSAASAHQRKEEDTSCIKNLLKDLNVDLSNIKVFRVGKSLPDKSRLLKVVLNNSVDAINVLRNKKNHVPGVKIFADQTKKQRDYYAIIKKKLDEINATGDNSKMIKFINNKPTIVNKTLYAQKNH